MFCDVITFLLGFLSGSLRSRAFNWFSVGLRDVLFAGSGFGACAGITKGGHGLFADYAGLWPLPPVRVQGVKWVFAVGLRCFQLVGLLGN